MFSLPKSISFKDHPFEYMDNIQISFYGNNLNFYQKYIRLASMAFTLAFLSLIAWVLFGFDSTPLQFIEAMIQIPRIGFNFTQLHLIYDAMYGKEMHWSAFVIYGLMYYFLSKHYNGMGIKGSKNVAYSACIMLFSVSLFEFYWMVSYAYFQGQWWVITPVMPQLRILLQNLAFFFVGVLGIFYMWADSFLLNEKKEIVRKLYRFNWNWKAFGLIVLSVVVAFVWWFYPFHVGTIQVGTWQNSAHFPQTLYTIDVNPNDGVNAGVWFYVSNDLIHAWNTVVKVLWTLSITYVARLKKVEI